MVAANVIGLGLQAAQRAGQWQTGLGALGALGLIAAKVHVEETLQKLVGNQGDTKLWRGAADAS